MSPNANQRQLTSVAILLLTLVAGWFAYAPGLGGDFLYDDRPHLNALEQVSDAESALQYVFSGTAGPLGRPLALATFVFQGHTVEDGASPFLRINILLHLFNACILAAFLYRLSILRRIDDRKALLVAVSATAIWLFMPLLASSSLIVIQRMTTLSATFTLLGLTGYLVAREKLASEPRKALICMSTSLVVGTLLAALAKENGVLLPTFALILEVTLLDRPRSISSTRWRAWAFTFLLLPTLVIVGYLASLLPYSETVVLRRDFTGAERLLTECVILWQYLLHAFIPQPGSFGPFHDGYPAARTLMNPAALLAATAWIGALVAALRWRRRYRLFAFATLWYLGGHVIESTVAPLELYFEHRNYLPVVGPAFALCALAFEVSRRKLVHAGIALYALVHAAVLFGLTSLWGDPSMAAHYWKERFPESVRAATTAATYQLMQGTPQRTLEALNDLAKTHPEAGYVRIQVLDISCIVAPNSNHDATLSELERTLPDVDFTYTAGVMLSDLISTVDRINCKGIDYDVVRKLAASLRANPRYRHDRLYNQIHQQLLARMAKLEGNLDQAARHIARAIDYRPMPGLNMMMVSTFVDGGRFDEARAFIEAARSQAPSHPFRRFVWLSRLDELETYVDKSEEGVRSVVPGSH